MQHLRPFVLFIFLGAILLSARYFDLFTKEVLSAGLPITQAETIEAPSAVQSASPGPRLDTEFDRERFAEISQVLNQIASGKMTLALIEKHGIGIHFESGVGSYFNPNTNQIVIDAKHEPVRAALSLVHEVTHARYLHEGSTADIISDGRQAYVEKKVAEEVEAVVKSIEAKMELEARGVDVSDLWYPLEYPYRKAYEVGSEAARNGEPGTNGDAPESAGRQAGWGAVFEGFMNEKTWTSVTKESYPDYYGREWDQVNLVA